jgi:hypothetical protein
MSLQVLAVRALRRPTPFVVPAEEPGPTRLSTCRSANGARLRAGTRLSQKRTPASEAVFGPEILAAVILLDRRGAVGDHHPGLL